MSYLERFEALAEELKATSKIDLLFFRARPPASASAIEHHARLWRVSEDALRLWSEAEGLTLVWDCEGDEDGIDPGSLVGDEDKSLLHARRSASGIIDLMPLEHVALSREADSMLRFDNHQPEGGAALVLDGSANPGVVFYDDQPRPLRVDLVGYLELLLLTAGQSYWFTLLTEKGRPWPYAMKVGRPGVRRADLNAVVKAARTRA